MSAAAPTPAPVRRPGASSGPRSPGGIGSLRLIETAALVLVGLLLAVATINDVARQTHINHRLVADLRTWRTYTGHAYHNLTIRQDFRSRSTREIVCGNTAPGGPKARVQLCLQIGGPVRSGRRAVRGGWYLPPQAEDLHRYRYGCFGEAKERRLCTR